MVATFLESTAPNQFFARSNQQAGISGPVVAFIVANYSGFGQERKYRGAGQEYKPERNGEMENWETQ